MSSHTSAFHPDLWFGRYLPPLPIGPRTVPLLNRRAVKPPEVDAEDLLVTDLEVPGPPGAPQVAIRLYQPLTLRPPAPALLWIHGGGYVIGNRFGDEARNIDFARTLGITVASVEYRLAPEHPAPAAVEDLHAAFTWLVEHAGDHDVDPARIAIGGASAGGGLTAALALLAHDRGGQQPAFQLLVYPMLDDRTVTRTDLDTKHVRVWSPSSNRYGWTSYLGAEPGAPEASPYAAPARREDLSGLPPAWLGVGTLDLFFEEDLDYAGRLRSAGVPCEVEVVPGAFHGFDSLFPRREVSREFWRAQAAALDQALMPQA